MRNRFIVALCALALATSAAFAQANGRISGFVTQEDDGSFLSGVTVVLNETGEAMVTNSSGAFYFSGLAPGDYSVSFSLADNVANETGIKVNAGATTVVQVAVPWDISFAESITVFGASRRTERIVEAPAAVTVISQDEIELEGGNGQLPKLVEFAPGVDFTQSGLYDINFNTRGFNSSLNRRILNLIDGRDASVPFLGASEWAAVSFAADELQSAELVRGPGSALYGANAFNGVLNMVTKNPRYNQGGMVRLTGGELGMARLDARYAGGFGSDWFYRATAGYQESEDFTVSRNVVGEYAGLPREAVPLALEEGEIKFGGLRIDKFFESGRVFTIEGGQATLEGPTFMTGIGRVQTTGVDRPWARANFNTEHWNWMAYYDARDAKDQVALASGALLWEDSSNLHFEVQGNKAFASDKLRLVGGASYHEQDIDTSNAAGVGTLMAEPKKEDQQAVFGQVDWNITDSLKLVAAARYDDSTLLEDAEFSPKGSIVWSPSADHGVRMSYNRAFQVPNYSEFFLRVPAGRPITAFAPLEAAACTRFGVTCGLGFIPILALGNADLEVEEIETYEIGYTGIFGGKLYMTVDYYQSSLSNFVTDLLPGVNQNLPAYAPPSSLPAPVVALILQTLRGGLGANAVGLTTINGGPALVLSYTNAGEVDTEGAEIAFNYYLNNNWIFDASYSWFDFEVKEQALGDRLFPNAPENKFNLGVTYRGGSFDASLKYRWVDEFFWAAGVFQGNVPDYSVLDFTAAYRLNNHIAFGIDVSNLLDDEHWEAFGGDIIGRRALGSVTFRF